MSFTSHRILLTLLCFLSGCTTQVQNDILKETQPILEATDLNQTALTGIEWSMSGDLVLQGWKTGRFPIYVGQSNSTTWIPLAINGIEINGRSVEMSSSRQLAFFDYSNFGLRIVNLDNLTETRPITGDANLSWSPNEETLAIMYMAAANTIAIDLLSLENNERQSVYSISDPHLTGFGDISWSPDGEKIAFSLLWNAAKDDLEQGDIYILSLDANDITQLTDTPNLSDDGISWTRDNQSIIYVSRIIGRPNGQISFANVNTLETQSISLSSPVLDASLSPQGDQIAVLTSNGDVYIVNLDQLSLPDWMADATD